MIGNIKSTKSCRLGSLDRVNPTFKGQGLGLSKHLPRTTDVCLKHRNWAEIKVLLGCKQYATQSSRLVPQNPNDEPVAELLKRIQAQPAPSRKRSKPA
jgi:hypothetical protein